MRRDSGVTLIEVLIALIIMVVGLVGILALFPPALQASKESMEETQAAIIAESIKHALTVALKNAEWAAGQGKYKVGITHDLKTSAKANMIYILLPKTTDNATGGGWMHFPDGGAGGDYAAPMVGMALPANADLETFPVFTLNSDPWVATAVKEVWDKNDPSEPYDQFTFSFDVKKVNTLSYITPAPPDLEKRTTLYEFEIHVFRKKPTATPVGGDASVTTSGTVPSKHVTTLTCKISVR